MAHLKLRLILIILILGTGTFSQKLAAQVTAQEIEKIEKALPEKAPANVKKTRKLLIFSLSKGYKHGAIPYAATMLELMGEKTGAFNTVYSEDMSVFAPDQLNQFDAVCFNNTTMLTFEEPLWRESLMAFVKSGKGIVGLHAATDNFYDWPEAAEMIGGVFAGHPWNAGGTWKVKINDPLSPLNAAFQGKDFSVKDEIYRVNQRRLRESSRVLVSLDMKDTTNLGAKGVRIDDRDIPISWIRSLDKGRVFYCSFGHNSEIYWNPKILQHYLAGIQYALGDLSADATPVPFNIEQAVNPAEIKPLLLSLSTFEYGQSLENQIKFYDLLRLTSASTSLNAQFEMEMDAFLASGATLAGKQFICHVLSVYGSEKSVPVLAEMLKADATAEMALYSLERITAEEVDEELLDQLDDARGKVRVGIINTLGQRRTKEALSDLVALMQDKDPLVVSAAIHAVGRIGGDEAAEALTAARINNKSNKELSDALLQVADDFASRDIRDQAYRIYTTLYSAGESQQVQYAALRGMILTAGKQSSNLILDAIRSEDSNMQLSAIQLVRQIPAAEDVSPIARMLPELSPSGQIQLLSALAGRSEPEVIKMMIAEAGSDNEDIQIAALRSLALTRDPESVPLFAEMAAVNTGKLKATAREALYRINGPGVDSKILGSLSAAPPLIKIEYLRAVAERRMTQAIPLLLKAMDDGDQKIRLEALKAMREVATPAEMDKVLAHLLQPKSEEERKELEKLLITIAGRIPDGQTKSASIVNALQSTTDSATGVSLLEVLGKIGDPQSLPVIRNSLSSKNPDIQAASIRALSNWPDSEPINDLLQVAKKSKNEKFRILALRGYVRLIGFEKNKSRDEILGMYQTAMELTTNSEEKRAVLSGLASVVSADALGFAARYIGDKSLQQEASATIISIASKLKPEEVSQKKPLLYQAKNIIKNEDLKETCQDIINELEKFEDFITVWKAAGPYENLTADLFAFAFAPENKETVEWKQMPKNTDKENYWHVDLGKFYGSSGPVAYLQTNFRSDKAQDGQLQVGSNDGIKVWLNGILVHANNVERGISPGEDKVAVKLIKGENILLLKIINSGGAWGGCARIRTPDGGHLEGLKYE